METTEIYFDDLEYEIEQKFNEYFTRYEIDKQSCSSIQFEGALNYIRKFLFPKKQRTILKPNNQYYDIEAVDRVCDIYISLCNRHGKACSKFGFSSLTGIEMSTLEEWKNGDKAKYRDGSNKKLSALHYSISQKLESNRQNSIANMLLDSKGNPVGRIAVLNHEFGWNETGKLETTVDRQLISRNDSKALPEQTETAKNIPSIPE